eukprot:5063958-Prymnesium_polylepis.1
MHRSTKVKVRRCVRVKRSIAIQASDTCKAAHTPHLGGRRLAAARCAHRRPLAQHFRIYISPCMQAETRC